ncbi:MULTISPECIES: D-alanyl-D-alanine carboxypeptidase family protein [unclassified Synechocystis]|uniref:M15 family metallopeptidase n=1 Tax=unclassified Synechocystis TaxID=2640012 RepID=UPI0004046B1E|nr:MULTISPECIES: M15 family metallopeptidase [unclassified Synechocystis]AIE74490.1 D-alanyl-D-alanine carboxypeptidase [Synechocystis sp. PCC 6714]MCT0254747.1 D-alanyl-D-alanine carboxypeptidase family protein [Synechocystis sp. CS-94]
MANKPKSSFNVNQDDIPEVIRDNPLTPSHSRPPALIPLKLVAAGLGLIILVLLSLLALWPKPQSEPEVVTEPSPTPTETPIDNLLGHLPYEEAPLGELKNITPDGRLKLRQAAADQFLRMQRDAQAQGISLAPISAFRTIKEQEQLFFDIKQQRNQEARQRAEVSAPPGYSEHHTGYAVDIGDGSKQGTHLSETFAQTKAFNWLQNNAAKYSFELSFPPNNPQGIAYEPWHWRYVGDRQSLELFYRARNLPQPSPTNPSN